jgi:hypothetical protein
MSDRRIAAAAAGEEGEGTATTTSPTEGGRRGGMPAAVD